MKLHRTLIPYCYQIGDTQVAVARLARHWQLMSLEDLADDSRAGARSWLEEHGLRGARFDTREDAVRSALAVAELFPLPQSLPPRLSPDGAGGYVCGDYRVERSARPSARYMPWVVSGPGLLDEVLSLRDAAMMINRCSRREA